MPKTFIFLEVFCEATRDEYFLINSHGTGQLHRVSTTIYISESFQPSIGTNYAWKALINIFPISFGQFFKQQVMKS